MMTRPKYTGCQDKFAVMLIARAIDRIRNRARERKRERGGGGHASAATDLENEIVINDLCRK